MAEMTPRDRANRAYTEFLQLMAPGGTGKRLAAEMGMSDGDVSELKTKHMEKCLLLLAHLDRKVVPTRYRCMTPITYEFLTETHQRMVAQSPKLVWEDSEFQS
jgi:hypothetical protein